MVKSPVKTLINEKSPLNHISNTPTEYNPPKKSRQEINRENYQKNKEKIKKRQQERYQNIKIEAIKGVKKYSDASDFRVLMSLKKYTELNPQKRENWLKFAWTLSKLAGDSGIEVKSLAVNDIIQVMKLREEADNLINDYWETARGEVHRGKYWPSLEDEERQRLINYWGRKRAKLERKWEIEQKDYDERGQLFEKEIAQMIDAKFTHEEKGKKGCSCYYCQVQKEVQAEIKAKEKRELKEWYEEQDRQRGLKDEEVSERVRGECAGCYEEKKINVESGLCKKCEKEEEFGGHDDD